MLRNGLSYLHIKFYKNRRIILQIKKFKHSPFFFFYGKVSLESEAGQMKTLELTSDVVFKSFMMSEATNNYKARLIHLITGIDEDQLKQAIYESNELKTSNKKDKIYKTDIIVKVKGNILNIEMNGQNYKGLQNKNTGYFNKLQGEQFDRGDSYLSIQKVIQINIDHFRRFNGNQFVYKFMMKEVEIGELETENLESYHLDLSYLKKRCYNKEDLTEIEKLCLLFVTEDINFLRGDPIMDDAIDELEKISSDEKIIGLYDAEKVQQKIVNTMILSAKLEGRETTQIEIATSLIQRGIDLETIAEATKLSIGELEKLKKDI